MMTAAETARQLVERLKDERSLVDELIDLAQRGLISVDDSGGVETFRITEAGKAYLRGAVQ